MELEEIIDQEKPMKVTRTRSRSMWKLWLSRKLGMTLIACMLLWFAYRQQVYYLSVLTYLSNGNADILNILIGAFVNITRDFMIAFSATVTAYVGITGWIDWKHGTSSTISQTVSFAKQTSENIQRIVHEGDPNAPISKPFGQEASK